MIETLRFDEPGACGSKDFAFPLPEGPYSFSGKLISLIWAMELTVSPGSETLRREITLSPTGREISGRTPDESKRQPLRGGAYRDDSIPRRSTRPSTGFSHACTS